MLDRIRDTPGVVLDNRGYDAQWDEAEEQLTGVIWKLERAQSFTEQADDPAWQAFAVGDWTRSLAVLEGERSARRMAAARYARQGIEFRRVRIVEQPVSAYLQWELHALKITDECGQPVRVLDASQVKDLERDQQLPELIVLGHRVLFEVRYDENWALSGACRVDDPAVIEQAAAEIARLWAMGEPLAGYFAREIAPLPVPSA